MNKKRGREGKDVSLQARQHAPKRQAWWEENDHHISSGPSNASKRGSGGDRLSVLRRQNSDTKEVATIGVASARAQRITHREGPVNPVPRKAKERMGVASSDFTQSGEGARW